MTKLTCRLAFRLVSAHRKEKLRILKDHLMGFLISYWIFAIKSRQKIKKNCENDFLKFKNSNLGRKGSPGL